MSIRLPRKVSAFGSRKKWRSILNKHFGDFPAPPNSCTKVVFQRKEVSFFVTFVVVTNSTVANAAVTKVADAAVYKCGSYKCGSSKSTNSQIGSFSQDRCANCDKCAVTDSTVQMYKSSDVNKCSQQIQTVTVEQIHKCASFVTVDSFHGKSNSNSNTKVHFCRTVENSFSKLFYF